MTRSEKIFEFIWTIVYSFHNFVNIKILFNYKIHFMKRFLMVIISLSFCTLFTEIYAQNQKNKVLFKNVIIT